MKIDMKIIIDCMSGDYAPDQIVKGALTGAEKHGVDVLCVGDEAVIQACAQKYNLSTKRMEIAHTQAQSITMEDEPGVIMKEKSTSSMALALSLLKEGKGDAVVSAGNTGALLTGATLMIRRIKGVRRAALGAIVPLGIPMMLTDAGAQTDATPENLYQYALMSDLFMRKVMQIERPRVGLINNGSEEHKGTELYQATHQLLKQDKTLHFIGNVEGRDIPAGVCDIIVADGFTGNIILKLCEGAGLFVKKTLKDIFFQNAKTKCAALLVKKNIAEIKRAMDYSEFGGAPFLGISKPVIKAHGSSNSTSIAKCIEQAKHYAQSGMIAEIEAMAAVVKQDK